MGLSKDLYRESSASVGWGDQYLLALYFFVSYGDTSMSLQGFVVRVSRRCDGQLHSFVVRLICPVTYVTRSMIRLMEGHVVFGSLQLRRIDWKQEMFKEEEELEREQGEPEPNTGKASSSGRPMEVDVERNDEATEAVTVDAAKVTEEKEEKEKPSWADVGEDETL